MKSNFEGRIDRTMNKGSLEGKEMIQYRNRNHFMQNMKNRAISFPLHTIQLLWLFLHKSI